jgi:hypothetical protein
VTGYKPIPTIGWLFLLQVIAAFGLAVIVAVSGIRLAAGALFALSTLGAACGGVGWRAYRRQRRDVAPGWQFAGQGTAPSVCVPRRRPTGSSLAPIERACSAPATAVRGSRRAAVGLSLAGLSLVRPVPVVRSSLAESRQRRPLLAAGIMLGVHVRSFLLWRVSGTSRPGPARLSDSARSVMNRP